MESTPKKLGFQQINEEIFQSTLKSSIKSKIFLGEFKEKRYADPLKDYRDVILIDKRAETEIVKDFERMRIEISEFYMNRDGNAEIPFFGYSSEAPGCDTSLFGVISNLCCLWTELDTDLPFGKYWFTVKTVKFRENEISLKLKCLRPVSDSDQHKTISSEKSKTRNGAEEATSDKKNETNFVEEWKALLDNWKTELNQSLLQLLSSINRRNIVESAKFISFLLISFLTFLIASVKYVGIFTIKLMEQLNYFIHVSSPFLLAVVDLISKICGAFFILITMIWRDSTQPRRPQPQRPEAIQYRFKNR